ncbi:MAG: DNA polymerase IV, partial [Phocaeicola sp.]
TLKIKFYDFTQITRSITQKQELKRLNVLLPLAKSLLKEVDYSENPIRLIGLTVSNSHPEENSPKPFWKQLFLDFKD